METISVLSPMLCSTVFPVLFLLWSRHAAVQLICARAMRSVLDTQVFGKQAGPLRLSYLLFLIVYSCVVCELKCSG